MLVPLRNSGCYRNSECYIKSTIKNISNEKYWVYIKSAIKNVSKVQVLSSLVASVATSTSGDGQSRELSQIQILIQIVWNWIL